MQSSARPKPYSGLSVRLPQSYSQDKNRNLGRSPSNVVNINGSRNRFNNVNFSVGNFAGVGKSKSSAMECESPNFLLKDRLESLHEEISTKNKELISLQKRAEELQSLIAMSEAMGAKVTTEYVL